MAITAGKTVGFKVGSQSSMDALLALGTGANAAEGHFYLTSDTHKLYIGNSDKSLSLINAGSVNITASTNDLPQGDNIVKNSFYYIPGDNILTIWDDEEGDWIQVNPVPDAAVKNISVTADSGNGNKGYKVSINNGAVTTSFNPQIKVGTTSVPFVNGVATLDVYSKDEFDEALKALNVMEYQGTVGANGSAGTGLTVSSTGVVSAVTGVTKYHVGDTFLLSEDISYGTDKVYKKGTLLIAKGTEADGVITSDLAFDVVEETTGEDTTYSFVGGTNSISLKPSTGSNTGTFTVTGGAVANGLSVSATDSGSGSSKTITFKHDALAQAITPTAETAATQTTGGTLAITAITSVGVDATGHVSSLKTKTFNVKDTNINTTYSLDAVNSFINASAASNVATVTAKSVLKDNANESSNIENSFKIGSSSLNISATAKTDSAPAQVTIDLAWQSF